MTLKVTWRQVLLWRMRRQALEPRTTATTAELVRQLCGVQAQVASSADQAVAVRQVRPQPGAVADALAEKTVMKTWAMRGTLHVMPVAEAGAYLSLMATTRTWEKPSWQKAFGVTAEELAALADAAADALAGRVCSRDELIAEVLARTGDHHLEQQLRSGWGTLLKPLAFMGLVCHGPTNGNRVTFTRPDTWLPSWGGVPDPDDAARVVIPAYLAAYGPATPETFDAWLTRGNSRKKQLRSWFALLADDLVTVDVEGQECLLRAADADELAAIRPSRSHRDAVVRLLPGFDQYVLGPGTADTALIPAHRRALISKTAGWISPVVLCDGKIAGVWEVTGGLLRVQLFEEAGAVPRSGIDAEAARLAEYRGESLSVEVTTT